MGLEWYIIIFDDVILWVLIGFVTRFPKDGNDFGDDVGDCVVSTSKLSTALDEEEVFWITFLVVVSRFSNGDDETLFIVGLAVKTWKPESNREEKHYWKMCSLLRMFIIDNLFINIFSKYTYILSSYSSTFRLVWFLKIGSTTEHVLNIISGGK